MSNIQPSWRVITMLVSILSASGIFAQEKKEFSYKVAPRAVISVTNHYGPITVKPSGNMQVVVTTVAGSAGVAFEHEQRGNRIELHSLSSKSEETDLVDYTVFVPKDALVYLRSSDGKVSVEGLHGDLVIEATSANVEVSDISYAHLHVKTLSGSVVLSDIRDSHLDVYSVRGDVTLIQVVGSSVEVHSGKGQIVYNGNPDHGGQYLLSSHSGNISVSIPANAAVDIKANSVRGELAGLPDINDSAGKKNLLQRSIVSVSHFRLRSFSGKIQVKQP